MRFEHGQAAFQVSACINGTLPKDCSHVLLLGLGRMWGNVSPARSALHTSNKSSAPAHPDVPMQQDTGNCINAPKTQQCI